jgi:hypothetical protein
VHLCVAHFHLALSQQDTHTSPYCSRSEAAHTETARAKVFPFQSRQAVAMVARRTSPYTWRNFDIAALYSLAAWVIYCTPPFALAGYTNPEHAANIIKGTAVLLQNTKIYCPATLSRRILLARKRTNNYICVIYAAPL